MNKKTLVQIIKNGGATLDRNEKTKNYKTGYQVSRKDCYTLKLNNINKILTAITDTQTQLQTNEFLGLWIDGGKIYIDISVKINNRFDAVIIGERLQQKSIFDWKNQTCITL